MSVALLLVALLAVQDDPPPELALRALDPVLLDVPDAPSPLARVRTWTFERPSGFRAIRHDGVASFSEVVVDGGGAVVRERQIGPLPEGLSSRTLWVPLADGRWLVGIGDAGEGERERIAFATTDAETGALELLPDFAPPMLRGHEPTLLHDVGAVLGGGFVASFTYNVPRELCAKQIVAFDAKGRARWTREHDWSLQGLTVLRDGRVLLRAGELELLGPDGRHATTIDFEPEDFATVTAELDGTFLSHERTGTLLWQFSVDGEELRSVTPLFSDGSRAQSLARNARIAPDGSLWSYDGRSFVRIGDDGQIVERVGPPDRAEDAMRDPGAGAIVAGRLYLQDEATGALHAWSETGERLFVGRTQPSDVDRAHPIARIAEAHDRSVWVETDIWGDGDSWLVWDAEGRRLGLRERQPFVAAPDGESSWSWTSRGLLVRRAASGAELVRIAREEWTIGDVAVAADGTVAVLEESAVSIWSAAGEPLATHALPSSMHALHVSSEWIVVASFGASVLLVHRSTGEVHARTVPGGAEPSSWIHGLSADGERLLCLARSTLLLHRFELP